MRVSHISFYYLFDVDGNYIFEGHSHGTYEANIVIDGNLEVTVEEKVIKLSKGDMIFWSPDLPHNNHASVGNVKFISVHFDLVTSMFPEKQIVFHHFGQDGMSLVKMFMEEAMKNSSPRNGIADIYPDEDESGSAQNGAAAIPLLESLLLISIQSTQAPEISDDYSARVFREAIDVMNSNLNNELNVPAIARLCGVSQTTLKTVFRRHAGKGVKKYYNELRIEAAKNTLESGKSISETAYCFGFSSPSYFSQFFKNNTGMSIREYLKRYKKH